MAGLEQVIKRQGVGYLSGLDSQLEESTKKLLLEKTEQARGLLQDAEIERVIQRGTMSLQNALARQWQGRIEGGRNVIEKMSPESYGKMYGAEKEYPSGGAFTGVWKPESYEGEIPEEARYAYDKYIGVSPEFGQKERELKLKAKEAAEKSRVNEETKLAEVEMKRELLQEKERERKETYTNKLIQEHDKRLVNLDTQYKNMLDRNEQRYGDDELKLQAANSAADIFYNRGRNFITQSANESGLVDSSTGKPYQLVDERTGKPVQKEEEEVSKTRKPLSDVKTFTLNDIREIQKEYFKKTGKHLEGGAVRKRLIKAGMTENRR